MVVRVLWSTKYRTPSLVYFISQPGGRAGSWIILEAQEKRMQGLALTSGPLFRRIGSPYCFSVSIWLCTAHEGALKGRYLA